jgi:prepilin-type N-terminal cleavage/methylation domain-containing protein
MSKPSHSKSQQKGFTLVELLTVVAVIGISLGVGIPNLQNFMQDNHQINAINEFSSYVSFARNEAVVRNTTVKLCVANETKTGCATTSDNWANGYLVIVEGETTALKIHDKLPGNQTITGNSTALVFSSNGMVTTAGTMTFCDGRQNSQPRSVNINRGSQVRLSNTATLSSCSAA